MKKTYLLAVPFCVQWQCLSFCEYSIEQWCSDAILCLSLSRLHTFSGKCPFLLNAFWAQPGWNKQGKHLCFLRTEMTNNILVDWWDAVKGAFSILEKLHLGWSSPMQPFGGWLNGKQLSREGHGHWGRQHAELKWALCPHSEGQLPPGLCQQGCSQQVHRKSHWTQTGVEECLTRR